MEDYRITHMKWDQVSGDHYHPVEVAFRTPDGSGQTTSANRLPFAVYGDVVSEPIGVLVRSGLCTKCGRKVITSKT
jgi:hypothetical protein